jgi:hypothetical protein
MGRVFQMLEKWGNYFFKSGILCGGGAAQRRLFHAARNAPAGEK